MNILPDLYSIRITYEKAIFYAVSKGRMNDAQKLYRKYQKDRRKLLKLQKVKSVNGVEG